MTDEGEDPVIEQPYGDHEVDDDRGSQDALDYFVHQTALGPASVAGLKPPLRQSRRHAILMRGALCRVERA